MSLSSILFLFDVERTFQLGSHYDILAVKEPNLSIIVLVEVTVHLEYFDLVHLLNVEAHLQYGAKAVVTGSLTAQSLFNFFIHLRVRQRFHQAIGLLQNLFLVFGANRREIVLEANLRLGLMQCLL